MEVELNIENRSALPSKRTCQKPMLIRRSKDQDQEAVFQRRRWMLQRIGWTRPESR